MKQRNSFHWQNTVYLAVLCAFFFVLACRFVPECDEYYFQYWTFDSLSDFIHTNPRDTGVLLVGVPANGRYLGNALGILQAKLYAVSGGVYLRAALFAVCSAGLLHLLYRYFCRTSQLSGMKGPSIIAGTLAGENPSAIADSPIAAGSFADAGSSATTDPRITKSSFEDAGRQRRFYYGGGFALCALLLTGAPYGIYSQVLAWGAGFANYVPPAVAMVVLWLALFTSTKKSRDCEGMMAGTCGGDAQNDGRTTSAVRRAALFVIAFAAQLFAEPVTVYFLFFGAALTADGWLWYRRLRRKGQADGNKPSMEGASVAEARSRMISALWMFLGFIAGAALMFSDSGYHQVGGDGRAVTADNMIRNLAIIASEVVVNHPLMTPLISLLLVMAAFQSIKGRDAEKAQGRRFAAFGLWALLTALLIPLHWFILKSNALVITDRLFAYENVNIFVGAAVAVIWVGLLALWSAGDCQDVQGGDCHEAERAQTSYFHTVRGRLWFWVGSLVIADGPLLVLYPIKSRHFFFSYIILCLIALELYGWLARRRAGMYRPAVTWLVRAGTVACCVGLLFVYGENHRVHQERIAYAEEQIAAGASEVTLPLLPYRAFVTNEGTSKGDISYVCYREKPWDVKFHFVLWEEWKGYGNE